MLPISMSFELETKCENDPPGVWGQIMIDVLYIEDVASWRVSLSQCFSYAALRDARKHTIGVYSNGECSVKLKTIQGIFQPPSR